MELASILRSVIMNDYGRQRVSAQGIMSTRVISILPQQKLLEAAQMMIAERISVLPVVDHQGCCLGTLAASDLLRFAGSQSKDATQQLAHLVKVLDDKSGRWRHLDLRKFVADDMAQTEVGEVMCRNPLTASRDQPLREIAQRMSEAGVHHMLVTSEGGHVEGIISALDFVKLAAVGEPIAV